jgi:osmotically-inducible protein OsmY
MRIEGKLAVVLSTLLLAGCAYHRPPVVYATPTGQVVGVGRNARTAADAALETGLRAEVNRYGDLANGNPDLRFYANNGTVTISGPVRNDRDRQMIETMVRNTPGVTSVNDQMQLMYPPTGSVTPRVYVSPAPVLPPPVVTALPRAPRIQAETLADQTLASRIEDQFRKNGIPADWLQNVTISVSNGAAYVQGFVATQAQREAIDRAVQAVSGVTTVYDQLQLR